jgi:CrcB protein
LPAAFAVFVGGGLGATLRWAVTLIAGAPMATWIVNIVGSFGLAWLTARGFSSDTSRLLLGTGLMGGFTTYSTFNQDTIRALEEGSVARAVLNVSVTLIVCLLAGGLGFWLGRR